ncbi:MAG TPA: response regulator transcription factor [Steroidobacter sp.]
MTRIAVAAASSLARAGLAAALREASSLELVSTLPLNGMLGSMASDLGLDVLLVELPPENEGEWEGELAALAVTIAPAGLMVLASARASSVEWCSSIVSAGVRGVIRRDATPETLVAAIVCAAAGLTVMEGAAAMTRPMRVAPQSSRIADPRTGHRALTPREREVLALLAEGLALKLVAARLGISEHTVKTHVGSLYEKLGASSRAEAIMEAARRGLVMF